MASDRVTNQNWDIVYERAIRDDGSLFFPERLTKDFLDETRRSMGSYLFANQYQNEIIPEGEQVFQKHWRRYYVELPPEVHTFAFIDPAISEEKTADYTALVVVHTDVAQNWYVRIAKRERINPSQLIELCFKVHEEFRPQVIGIEDVAFQRAVIHFGYEEMKRRGIMLPLHGLKRSPDRTKHMRIMSLVPRFEWGSLYLSQGLHDLELELAQFPRGSHDDILDALSSIAEIASYPVERKKLDAIPHPSSPQYESWYVRNVLLKRAAGEPTGYDNQNSDD